MFLLDRNVRLGECITRLPKTQAEEFGEQPHWRKRLETIPKRLSEALSGDSLEFDKDTKRWRRGIRYYKEVRFWRFWFHIPSQEMHQMSWFLSAS